MILTKVVPAYGAFLRESAGTWPFLRKLFFILIQKNESKIAPGEYGVVKGSV